MPYIRTKHQITTFGRKKGKKSSKSPCSFVFPKRPVDVKPYHLQVLDSVFHYQVFVFGETPLQQRSLHSPLCQSSVPFYGVFEFRNNHPRNVYIPTAISRMAAVGGVLFSQAFFCCCCCCCWEHGGVFFTIVVCGNNAEICTADGCGAAKTGVSKEDVLLLSIDDDDVRVRVRARNERRTFHDTHTVGILNVSH